jgi:hypothetical protein
VKEIQVSSNEGTGPLQRGGNHKNVKKKKKVGSFKNLLIQILTSLGTNHPRGEVDSNLFK